jgi:hypothetical protein
MKKVIQALCALIIIVGVSITGGVKANAYDTFKGLYYQHGATDVKLRLVATHSGTILGLAYENEPYTADCDLDGGDSYTVPWDGGGTSRLWFSARDRAERSHIKGYSGAAWMVPKNTTHIALPADFPDISHTNTCDFPGKTPVGTSIELDNE